VELFKPSQSSDLYMLILHGTTASLFCIQKASDPSSQYHLSISLKSELTFNKNNLLESSLFFSFEGMDYICLCSCDNQVHVYQLSTSTTEMQFLNSLQGHTNKVKELTFAVIKGKGILASGSLDNYIRLWAFKSTEELEESYKKSKYVYYANEKHFIMLESVLFGHTEAVSGIKFFEDINGKCNLLGFG
jgi:WD40 repeat protein